MAKQDIGDILEGVKKAFPLPDTDIFKSRGNGKTKRPKPKPNPAIGRRLKKTISAKENKANWQSDTASDKPPVVKRSGR